MKRSFLLFSISGILLLSACSTKPVETTVESTSEMTLETMVETTSETTLETTVETASGSEKYVHGEDGYFNLLEEYPEIQMEKQVGGTCWIYAGKNSIETNYVMKTGNYITIDPMELLDNIYRSDKDEGFAPVEGSSAIEAGGSPFVVVAALSDGINNMTLDSAVVLDANDRDAIKANLHDRGSISVGVNDTSPNYSGYYYGYFTLNYTEEEFEHNVAIIGYDDHFPKEYFNTQATEDGAWIVYNSQYDSDYCYLSYSAPLEAPVSISVTDKYSAVLGYDAGVADDTYINLGDSTTTANVFHKSGTLQAVGTYNSVTDEQDIKIEIYDSSFSELLYSQDAHLDYQGYHTIELDTPIEVTDYAIAITYSKAASVEGESVNYDTILYSTKSESGQSYVKLDDWVDLTDENIKSELGIDFFPGNCCIKALYQ